MSQESTTRENQGRMVDISLSPPSEQRKKDDETKHKKKTGDPGDKKDESYFSSVLSIFGPAPPTEMKTSETHPLHIDFVDAVFPNFSRLGMSMCPGRCKKSWSRNLLSDLEILTWHKTDLIVSLVATAELESMGIPHFFDEIRRMGMDSLHCPIPDKWIPESMDLLVHLVDKILVKLHEGKCIVVHCNGGKGRTGLVCCSVLVTFGFTPDQAITLVRECREGTIRNPAQIIYLNMFTYAWSKFEHHKKKHEKRAQERASKDKSEQVQDLDQSQNSDQDQETTEPTQQELPTSSQQLPLDVEAQSTQPQNGDKEGVEDPPSPAPDFDNPSFPPISTLTGATAPPQLASNSGPATVSYSACDFDDDFNPRGTQPPRLIEPSQPASRAETN